MSLPSNVTTVVLRCFLVATVILLFGHNVDSRTQKQIVDFDFRKVKWGMSIELVKQSEAIHGKNWKPQPPGFSSNIDNKTSLIYKGYLFDQPCQLIYQFNEEKLERAQYQLLGEDVRDEVTRMLTQQYGDSINVPDVQIVWFSEDKDTMIRFMTNAQLIFYEQIDESKIESIIASYKKQADSR